MSKTTSLGCRIAQEGACPGELPESLKKQFAASFLRVRSNARGQSNDHNSMLIHVTRFTTYRADRRGSAKGTGIVAGAIAIRRRQRQSQLTDELEDLWNKDFVPRLPPYAECG